SPVRTVLLVKCRPYRTLNLYLIYSPGLSLRFDLKLCHYGPLGLKSAIFFLQLPLWPVIFGHAR
ncbi:MAG: hypothetical protein V4494_04860, partial [Chlamydiota bacterium]